MIWAHLVHLSYNMWYGPEEPYPKTLPDRHFLSSPNLRFDKKLWNDLLRRMLQAGVNVVLIDLGDGVRYESHPELAVKGAWSVSQLKKELAKLRKMGLEPIPKLNFSTCHDRWLGPYARQVSTPVYYEVCKNLIAEVIEIFDRPQFFHLGMDEESWDVQRFHAYALIRQGDLWWHDLLFLVKQVEKGNARAWMWSDAAWHHPDDFVARMPRSVIQNNWYYGMDFTEENVAFKTWLLLQEHGFDQIPSGSNWISEDNLPEMVRVLSKKLDSKHLLGYMQTVWKPMLEDCRKPQVCAIKMLERARSALDLSA